MHQSKSKIKLLIFRFLTPIKIVPKLILCKHNYFLSNISLQYNKSISKKNKIYEKEFLESDYSIETNTDSSINSIDSN